MNGLSDSGLESRFLRLLTSNQRALSAYIGTIMGGPKDVDDVLQETNIVLWNKFDQFEDSRSDASSDFLRWACAVARFEALKFIRKRRSSPLSLAPDVVELLVEESRESNIAADMRHHALQACLGKLRSQDRSLVRSCYAPGQPIQDVASKIRRPVNSVYKSLGRIRSQLLECIEREVRREETAE